MNKVDNSLFKKFSSVGKLFTGVLIEEWRLVILLIHKFEYRDESLKENFLEFSDCQGSDAGIKNNKSQI